MIIRALFFKGKDRQIMIKELNKGIRGLFLLFAGFYVFFKLTEGKGVTHEEGEDGYQQREFDDIW